MAIDPRYPTLSLFKTGVTGHCPRCGEGRLFTGFLKLRSSCDACGLSYDFADPADGPAVFVIAFGCLPSVFLALWIEVAFAAPYWVHLVTSLPFLLLTCVPPLRPVKGWLIATQYFYKAEEGKLARPLQPSR